VAAATYDCGVEKLPVITQNMVDTGKGDNIFVRETNFQIEINVYYLISAILQFLASREEIACTINCLVLLM